MFGTTILLRCFGLKLVGSCDLQFDNLLIIVLASVLSSLEFFADKNPFEFIKIGGTLSFRIILT